MDWSKAKTMLIVAFIITNIILGYNLYINKLSFEKGIYFQKDYIYKFNKLLKSKNIKVNCDLPKETPKLGNLTVQYENSSIKKLESILQKTNSIEEENKKITFKGNMILKDFNEKHVKDEVEKFLSKYKLNENICFEYMNKIDNHIEIIYCEQYKDYFLEESYMKFRIYSNGNFIFERLWLVPGEENIHKKKVITSVEAILNIFDELDENSVIEEIKLGYYSEPKDINVKKTKKATALPTWRIKTNDNKYYYVQAFDF